MFGIGIPELMLILVLALVVLGPEKLPKLARQIARFVGDLKRASEEFKEQLNVEVDGIDDIKELKDIVTLKNPEVWKKNFDNLVNVHEPADHAPHGAEDRAKDSASESGESPEQVQSSATSTKPDMGSAHSSMTDTGTQPGENRTGSQEKEA